jgi:sugar phosphate isomerase/epimerase
MSVPPSAGPRAALWWGSLESADLPTLVRAAAAAGFAEVSTTPAMYFAARAAGWSDAALATLLDDHNIAVPVVDPLLCGLPGARAADSVGRRWRSTFEHGEDDCHRVADALGSTVINAAHFLGAPTPVDELIDALGSLTDRAARRGRCIAVEAMPEGSIVDLAGATTIVRAIARANCGLTLDTWHWWRSGGRVEELDALRPGEVLVLQVSDARSDVRGSGVAPPVRDRLLPGSGDMPLVELVRRVAVTSPQAHVGLEVFDTSNAAPYDRRAAEAARTFAALVAACASRSPHHGATP